MRECKTFSRHHKADDLLPWPTPAKFQLGQIVCHDLLIEDELDKRNGQTFRDYGQITGLYWDADKGGQWVYFVKWVESNSYPDDIGCVDEIQEQFLKSLRGIGKQTKTELTQSAAEFFEDFSEHKSKLVDSRTLEKYHAVQTRLSQFFEDAAATSLTPSRAEAFIEFLKEFQRPVSIKGNLAILSACWQWGLRSGRVNYNPWQDIRLKVPPKQKPKPFTRAEIEAILTALDGSYSYYKPYVEFLFLTGCRTAEAIGLRWRHIADDFSSIWIGESITRGKQKATKTNRDRIFPCNTRVTEFLEAIKPANAQPDDLVFPTPKGGPLDDQNFCKRVWRPALKLAGVSYRRPYNTRHSFISHCLAARMNPVEVASIVGHDVQTLYRCYAGVIAGRPNVPDFLS